MAELSGSRTSEGRDHVRLIPNAGRHSIVPMWPTGTQANDRNHLNAKSESTRVLVTSFVATIGLGRHRSSLSTTVPTGLWVLVFA
jgi:hypothetical protein